MSKVLLDVMKAFRSKLDEYVELLLAIKSNFMMYFCIVFIHFYSASHNMNLSEVLPTTAIDIVWEFACRNFATGNASEGLAQGPYLAPRAEFEPATLRSKGFCYSCNLAYYLC